MSIHHWLDHVLITQHTWPYLDLVHSGQQNSHIWSNSHTHPVNKLRAKENGPYFWENTFKCIPLNANYCIFAEISHKFPSKGQTNNNSTLVQVMAWCRTGNKPLPEPMLTNISHTIWHRQLIASAVTNCSEIEIQTNLFNQLNSSTLVPQNMSVNRVSIGGQIMACHPFGTKPLSEPILGYCQLNPQEKNFREILIKIQSF